MWSCGKPAGWDGEMRSSFEFLGVTLVPFGSKPRLTVRTSASFSMALLPDGRVAVRGTAPFRFSYPKLCQELKQLAGGMLAVGAITQETHDSYASQVDAERAKRHRRYAAEELNKAAEKLSFTFSKTQSAKIAAALEAA